MIRRQLTAAEITTLAPYVPRVDLEEAVLHIGHVPWYLPRRYCAIVRGNNVYVRAGVPSLHGQGWLGLLGHELTHVGQYRRGMTAFKYLCSAIFGYRRSSYEREAFRVQEQILTDLAARAAAPIGRAADRGDR